MGLTECFLNLIVTTVFRDLVFQNNDIFMFLNWQGVNPMGPSVPLAYYKNKTIFTNIKMYYKQPYNVTQKRIKGLTQSA